MVSIDHSYKNFAVTGASGDIGASIARFIVDAGRRLTAVLRNDESVRKFESRMGDVSSSASLEVIDLLDSLQMRRLLLHNDTLYHMAALRGMDRKPAMHPDDIAVNVFLTLRLVWLAEAVRPDIRFVFPSAGNSSYLENDARVQAWVRQAIEFILRHADDIKNGSTMRELNGVSATLLRDVKIPDGCYPYELGKYCVEEYLKRGSRLTNYVAPRIVFVYGPGVFSEGTTTYRLIKARLTGRQLSLNLISREFIHIHDLTEILWQLGNSGDSEHRFPVVTQGTVLFGDELWDLIERLTPSASGTVQFFGERKLRGKPQSAAWSRRVLGKSFTSIEEGIATQIADLRGALGI